MNENKQKALDYLLMAINETNRNLPTSNHIIALKLIDRKDCVDMFGRKLHDGQYVRVVWSDDPNRDDGYYDINVEGDNAMGCLVDVMAWLNKKL